MVARRRTSELNRQVLARRLTAESWLCGWVLLALGLAAAPPAAAQLGPQTVVRKFCEADGMAKRVTIQGWGTVAPLVEWPLEPAWDRVALISSYTVGWPEPGEGDTLNVEVRYSVTADINAVDVKESPRIDSVIFRVRAEGAAWRVMGPPPPPYIFEQQVDPQGVRQSIERGGVNFVANSAFVWHMMQSVGWNVPLIPTQDLLKGKGYREVQTAKAGDLVAYLRDGLPYHVGFLESPGTLVSSTLNGGIMRTTLDAFAGETKTLRLVQPEEAKPEPGEDEPEVSAEESEAPKAPPTLTPKPRPKPTPRKAAAAKKSLRASPRPTAKPVPGGIQFTP